MVCIPVSYTHLDVYKRQVLTGTLAAKLKMHARLSAQLAFRTQILFDTDRLLQKARSQKEILEITCTQLARLFDQMCIRDSTGTVWFWSRSYLGRLCD